MAVYPEKRGERLTGQWYGEHKAGGRTTERRYRRKFDSKAKADAYVEHVKAFGEEPDWARGEDFSGRTFRAVALECKARGGPRKGKWKAGRDSSVIQRLEYVMDRLGSLDIEAVSTADLDGLVESLAKRPGKAKDAGRLAGGTINRYLTVASAVLTYAVERGHRKTAMPVVPWQQEGSGREAVLSPEAEDAIVRWMQEHVTDDNTYAAAAICIRVLAATGMRLGELETLGEHPEQIEDEWLTLRASQTKTNRPRKVWIDPTLADQFRALARAGRVPTGHRLRTIFNKAVEACGNDPELVLHSLRHTRATRLLDAGVNPVVVMEMLGWTSLAMLKRYSHVSMDTQREAAKKLLPQRGNDAGSGEIISFGPVSKSA